MNRTSVLPALNERQVLPLRYSHRLYEWHAFNLIAQKSRSIPEPSVNGAFGNVAYALNHLSHRLSECVGTVALRRACQPGKQASKYYRHWAEERFSTHNSMFGLK